MAQAVSLALPLPSPPRLAPVPPVSPPRSAPARLWLCVYLPELMLEALLPPSKHALAIAQGEGTKRVVAVCNARAQAQGIDCGMRISAARALAPELRVFPRRESREQATLERLAAWAQRFTPVVVPDDHVLLLEVRTSLRLFGGFENLRKDLSDGLTSQGYSHHLGTAPTPLAAHWLARAGSSDPVFTLDTLPGRLGSLPIRSLGWPATPVVRLERCGVRRLLELMRLPREGLARRLGREWPLLLDSALGRAPDPRRSFVPAEHFHATLDLPLETRQQCRLMPALRHLLGQLEAFLVSRDAGVDKLEVLFHHHDTAPTRVPLVLRREARRADELADLLARRLESVSPSAMVRAVGLGVERLHPWAAVCGSLLRQASSVPADMDTLIQNLQARLGEGAVYSVAPQADHRPERAWHKTAPLEANAGSVPPQPRPLWLLPDPRPLRRDDISLLKGPERIISGWWDDAPVARDYYQARHIDGRSLWVFKDLGRDGRSWFVHGMFP